MGELAAFWSSLEAKARPEVERQLKTLGFALASTSGGAKWQAFEIDATSHFSDCDLTGWVTATSASDLIDRVTERRKAIARATDGGKRMCRCWGNEE